MCFNREHAGQIYSKEKKRVKLHWKKNMDTDLWVM